MDPSGELQVRRDATLCADLTSYLCGHPLLPTSGTALGGCCSPIVLSSLSRAVHGAKETVMTLLRGISALWFSPRPGFSPFRKEPFSKRMLKPNRRRRRSFSPAGFFRTWTH